MKLSCINFLLFSSTALLLSACGGSDNDDSPEPTPAPTSATPTPEPAPSTGSTPTTTPEPMANRQGNCPTLEGLQVIELDENRCQISGELTADATLSSDITWYLEGGLHIGNATYQPTLTIEAGTNIHGDNTDAVDYVLVSPGSSLQANGTRVAPVRFLSDDDNNDGAGEWGGLIIKGQGELQGDNLLNYVVVAEAGASVTVEDNTYQDNISIEGTDDGTRFTFVQSHDSARDGIWIKDSSARLSWILVTGAVRDGIWYRNYNGLVKDLMVLARPESGRSGIYASASELQIGLSSPRFVNVTLFDLDSAVESAVGDASKREFGILFADYTIEGEFANILMGNWKNGCYEVEPTADLTNVSIDGVHCANNFGVNPNFRIVREGGVDFGNVGNGNGDGMRYYNGAATPIVFTGQNEERLFTAGWYLVSIGSLTNGLVADSNALNGWRDGDTNGDDVLNADDIGATPLFGESGTPLTNTFGDIVGFNDDVAANTGGYDLTHNGAVRSGSDENVSQWNGWTVSTEPQQGFSAMDLVMP